MTGAESCLHLAAGLAMDTGCLVVPSPHLPMAAQSFLVAACPGGKNTVSDDVSNNQGFSASVPLNFYHNIKDQESYFWLDLNSKKQTIGQEQMKISVY